MLWTANNKQCGRKGSELIHQDRHPTNHDLCKNINLSYGSCQHISS